MCDKYEYFFPSLGVIYLQYIYIYMYLEIWCNNIFKSHVMTLITAHRPSVESLRSTIGTATLNKATWVSLRSYLIYWIVFRLRWCSLRIVVKYHNLIVIFRPYWQIIGFRYDVAMESLRQLLNFPSQLRVFLYILLFQGNIRATHNIATQITPPIERATLIRKQWKETKYTYYCNYLR